VKRTRYNHAYVLTDQHCYIDHQGQNTKTPYAALHADATDASCFCNTASERCVIYYPTRCRAPYNALFTAPVRPWLHLASIGLLLLASCRCMGIHLIQWVAITDHRGFVLGVCTARCLWHRCGLNYFHGACFCFWFCFWLHAEARDWGLGK
jgi:hypothetical protein